MIPGAGLFLVTALGLGVSSIFALATNGDDPAASMIAAVSAALEGLILAVGAWFVLQKTIGREQADVSPAFPFANWHVFTALGLGGIALLIGGLAAFSEIKWLALLLLPILTILIIAPPIWIMLGLGTKGLDLGPRWRVWGIIGVGMTVGPLIMIVLEIVIAIVLVLGASIYLAVQPGMAEEIIRLGNFLENETNPEVMLRTLGPYVMNPAVITAALTYIALIVPLIEELLKPLGVWLFARKIESPAQGFALGLLSGAAYALVESLGASGRGGPDWTVVVAIRAGTSFLHITTTGLMGWAIIAAWRERRILRLLATYAAVVVLHGLWNGSTIGTSLAVIASTIGESNWIFTIVPAAICGMLVLAIGMVAVLLASNRRARKLSRAEAAPSNPILTKNTTPDTESKITS